MEVWGMLVVFAAVAVAAISGESATFPEVARKRSNTRIVSGWEAEIGQFPFQLSMRMVSPLGAVSSCGASIISQEWGLTAAHCTAGRSIFVLRGGVVNLTQPAVIFETTKFYNHPLYNNNLPSAVQPNDIGLLEFGRKLIFNAYIQPIRLQRDADKNFNYAGVQLTASGWGRTWTNGASPENLNWVYLSGDTNERCWSQYGSIITDATICASGYNDTTQSTCQGDSGGPLTVIDKDGKITQVGVTSFVSGTGCHTNFPAGFIRPGHYHDWFYEVTGNSFDWEETKPTEAPEEVTTAGPEEGTTAGPEEATTAGPEEATTAGPEEATTAGPEEGTTAGPEEVTTAGPEEGTTAGPEEGTTAGPEEVTTAGPEEGTTAGPEEGTTAGPEEVTTAGPEEVTTAGPEEGTTAGPEEGTTAGPEEGTTATPENEWDPDCEEEATLVHFVNN